MVYIDSHMVWQVDEEGKMPDRERQQISFVQHDHTGSSQILQPELSRTVDDVDEDTNTRERERQPDRYGRGRELESLLDDIHTISVVPVQNVT